MTARPGPGGEIDRDSRRRCAVVDDVLSRTPVQRVRTLSANQSVVALPPDQGVVAFSADQRVIALASLQTVVTSSSLQTVGAAASLQTIPSRVAHDLVVIPRADDVLDPADPIALGMAAGPGPGGKVDRDSRCRCAVVDDVLSRTPVQRVRALCANQSVVAHASLETVVTSTALQTVRAGATLQNVPGSIAGELIPICGAHDALDSADPVALGMTAGAGPGGEIDRDPRRRCAVVDDILSRAPVQRIRALPRQSECRCPLRQSERRCPRRPRDGRHFLRPPERSRPNRR